MGNVARKVRRFVHQVDTGHGIPGCSRGAAVYHALEDERFASLWRRRRSTARQPRQVDAHGTALLLIAPDPVTSRVSRVVHVGADLLGWDHAAFPVHLGFAVNVTGALVVGRILWTTQNAIGCGRLNGSWFNVTSIRIVGIILDQRTARVAVGRSCRCGSRTTGGQGTHRR